MTEMCEQGLTVVCVSVRACVCEEDGSCGLLLLFFDMTSCNWEINVNVLKQCCYPTTTQHCITSQKLAIIMVMIMKISNL